MLSDVCGLFVDIGAEMEAEINALLEKQKSHEALTRELRSNAGAEKEAEISALLVKQKAQEAELRELRSNYARAVANAVQARQKYEEA